MRVLPIAASLALLATPVLATAPATPAGAAQPSAQAPARALVHAKSAPIWSEPRANSRKVHTVFAGADVDVLGTQGEWSHVRNGTHTGWIESNLLQPARAQ